MTARNIIAGLLFGAIAAHALPASAYINPPAPRPTTIAVERTAATVPVTDAAVVRIQRPNSIGTGFYIGDGLIVTAAHVVAGANTVSIKTEDGRVSSARVVAIDEKSDAAILRTVRGGMLAASLDCGEVPVGEPITAIGNPMGQEFVSAFGRVAGKPREIMGRQLYITDMTTVMGQSGSAVFARGKAIGVVSAVMLAQVHGSASLVGFGLVVPSSVVCEMLAGMPAKGEGEGV